MLVVSPVVGNRLLKVVERSGPKFHSMQILA
jgi:hypothetical protein